MTQEEYTKKKQRLERELNELNLEYLRSGEFQVGDIVVDDDGHEYLVRSLVIRFGMPDIDTISKRKVDGGWSVNWVSKYCVRGKLRKKEKVI